MKKVTCSALAILMAAGLSVAADAQARERGVTQVRERGVNARQHQQRERVVAGVRSGNVTPPESRQRHREARGIERKERAFRADGRFSRSERRVVQRDLDRHSRNIQRARNGHARRGWHGGRNWGRDRGVERGPQGWRGGRDWGRGRGFGQDHSRHGVGGIDRLQHRQQAQIRQGIRGGSLTRREARRLRGERHEIAARERSYWADGRLTRNERRDLRGELKDAQRHISNQSHDDDRRFRR